MYREELNLTSIGWTETSMVKLAKMNTSIPKYSLLFILALIPTQMILSQTQIGHLLVSLPLMLLGWTVKSLLITLLLSQSLRMR